MNDLVTPPERQASMHLPDGRTLAWSEWGPQDGLPVLFCTGAGMSGSLGFGAQDLWELGVNLLAIDRPGLGRSDAHPSKTLSSWVADTRALVQAQHVTTCGAVGFSQGAPFAYALADQRLVQALAIVSGQDDLTHSRLRPLVHPDVARMIEAVHHDAVGFARQMAHMATPDGLWQLIMGMSAARDRMIYATDTFSTAYQRALHEGFAQGPQGYVRDLVNALSVWPMVLEDIAIPVDLWYGGLDTSIVHSPDFGATLATRLPHATHTVDSTEGGSILWTRSRAILTRLKAHLAPS